MTSVQQNGRIITFYSYKGGTGRSMALANVAWLLALNGCRVLVVDWDLEAPGVHRYFHPFLEDKELVSTPGLLDMVESLAAQAATSRAPLDTNAVDIFHYITPLEWPRHGGGDASSAPAVNWKRFPPNGRIDLMPAGRQGPGYSKKLSAFNWIDFYERLGGRPLLAAARAQMRSVYDFVLIDSRTGVSDTSGICTVEMPDSVVVCFTLNDQSIRGASGVAQSIREQRLTTSANASAATPFRIFPVPTRVEISSDQDKREAALDLAQRTFAPFLDHLDGNARSQYWGAVQLAYFTLYAFEEIPAVFGDNPDEILTMMTPIKQITGFITDRSLMPRVSLAEDPQESEAIRRRVLGWYLRPNLKARPDPVLLAQSSLDMLDPNGREALLHTLLRFVVVAPSSGLPGARPLYADDLDDPSMSGVDLLARHDLVSSTTVAGRSAYVLQAPSLVDHWDVLKNAIEGDQDFLKWRTGLSTSVESWQRADHDESALLRGRFLSEALRWTTERSSDLSQAERQFIESSQVHADAQDLQRKQEIERSETLTAMLESRSPDGHAGSSRAQESRSPLVLALALVALMAITVLLFVLFAPPRPRQKAEPNAPATSSEIMTDTSTEPSQGDSAQANAPVRQTNPVPVKVDSSLTRLRQQAGSTRLPARK